VSPACCRYQQHYPLLELQQDLNLVTVRIIGIASLRAAVESKTPIFRLHHHYNCPHGFPKTWMNKSPWIWHLMNSLLCSPLLLRMRFLLEPGPAIRYALLIWQQYLNSPQPIGVRVVWEDAGSDSYLAAASPTDFEYGEYFAEGQQLFEAVAIHDKKYNTDSFGADIEITVNSARTADFYTGIDGNCPVGQFDLATIILHEVGHGLGFIATTRVDDSGSGGSILGAQAEIGFELADRSAYFNYDVYLQNSTGRCTS
jgi:hypothetical protein